MKKLVLVMVSLAVVACGQRQETQEEEALRVTVEKAALTTDCDQLPYVGVVEEEASTSVSFTGMAVLKSMTVSEGQAVRKGQLLAVIDETQSRNALEAAKATLDQALDAQARMKQLHDSQSLPEIKWVEVQSQVSQAQSAYDMAKKSLDDCRIYAPVSGVVGTKIMNVGETVLPTEPVLTILSIDKVKVRVAIPEREIAAINGAAATAITVDALPGDAFVGGHIEKGVTADPLTHTYDIRIAVQNPGHKLLPGMVARVKIRNGEGGESGKAVCTLPVTAVQQATDKSLFVWLVREGKATRQPVTAGAVTGNRIVIESGISEGDQVIVEGYQKLGEGTPVRPTPGPSL